MCKVKFISWKVATLNVIGTLKKKITSMKVGMKAFYKFSNNEYRPILVDHTVDYCAVKEGLLSSPLYNFFEHVWANKTNLFQPCPLMPGEYYVKDWNFEAAHLPSIVPAGRYIFQSIFRMQSNYVLMNNSVYFYVANYGILDLAMG